MIIAVNSNDAEALGKRLKQYELATHKYNVTVFSFIRGVKTGGDLKDEFNSSKHLAFLEATVGFAVSTHPTTDALICTTFRPSIALERMDKKTADIATGFNILYLTTLSYTL